MVSKFLTLGLELFVWAALQRMGRHAALILTITILQQTFQLS
jgi:hypothetical protein